MKKNFHCRLSASIIAALLLPMTLALTSCENQESTGAKTTAGAASNELSLTTQEDDIAEQESEALGIASTLGEIIASRTVEEKARDESRRPQRTLEFFDVRPDMTVLEVLPGGGWYTRILAPYLAADGGLYAVTYADDMWPLFGFFSEERIAERKQQMLDWPKVLVQNYGVASGGEGSAFGRIPQSWAGQFDRVLMIRALHNLNRFESEAGTRSAALGDLFTILKPGGKVGVVQHQGPETASDEWALGKNGYLKKSGVVAMFEEAGFVLEAESALNENDLDKPTENDFVWRLPPSLRGHDDNHASLETARAIGESSRMTLLFVKPE